MASARETRKKMRKRKSKKKQRREDSRSEVDLEPDSVCSASDLLSYTFLSVQVMMSRVQDHRPALSSCESCDFIALSLYIFRLKKREKEVWNRGEVKFLEVSAGGWLSCRV